MVSVIVPVYNVETYICQCLASVAAQTYGDYELIVVDDGSTDGSMELAKKFAADGAYSKYVRFIAHGRNRGLSAARNTGTAAAHGEYVFYLDSDDSLSPDCLRLLVEKADATHADVTAGNFRAEGADAHVIGLRLKDNHPAIGADPFNAYLAGACYMMAWNKLVRRDFIEKHGIAFAEGLIHEDCAWSFTVACLATRFAYVFENTYNYNVRCGSIQTTRDFSPHFNAYCRLLPYYACEAARYGKSGDPHFRHWLEIQKARIYGIVEHQGDKARLNALYRIIRSTLPEKRLAKPYLHYLLPEFLGRMAYKKWHGMFVC